MYGARDGLSDARECVRRSLAAMTETQDVETRAALWRMAVKYALKMRAEHQGERTPMLRSRAPDLGGKSERVWLEG